MLGVQINKVRERPQAASRTRAWLWKMVNYFLDLEGKRKGPYRYSIRGDWDTTDDGHRGENVRRIGTLTAEEEERHKKLEDDIWDESLPSGIDFDVEYEDHALNATMLDLMQHYRQVLEGFRTVQYFTRPLLQATLGRNCEEGKLANQIVPSTPYASQVVPLFASIKAAQQRLIQAGAALVVLATPPPIEPVTPLPLRTR